jgi:hypothetical protein
MRTFKIKYRVYETKKCRKCRRIHPAPTNRYVFHQGKGYTADATIQEGHDLWVHALEAERGRKLRPYYQYTIELGV